MAKRHWSEVLDYSHEKVSQSVVRRHYAVYRTYAKLPDLCDNEKCRTILAVERGDVTMEESLRPRAAA